MNILITNDDGIYAPGIAKLAQIASKFGNVYVVAPEEQCSAMAHRVSIMKKMTIRRVSDFECATASAYAVSGTPADCVKVAVEVIMKEKPDVVLSGINKGFNAGIDIEYSGTVAAAMEGVLKGIHAIALSDAADSNYEIVDAMLPEILEELIRHPAPKGMMWNVNFPEGTLAECRGIQRACTAAKAEFYPDRYVILEQNEDRQVVMLDGARASGFEEGTDLNALCNHYISIGILTNTIMGQ